MEKIILGGGVRGARNCEILSAIMVGQRRKFFKSSKSARKTSYLFAKDG